MIELVNKYHEIFGLYMCGGEERTKNIDWEIGQIEETLIDSEQTIMKLEDENAELEAEIEDLNDLLADAKKDIEILEWEAEERAV